MEAAYNTLCVLRALALSLSSHALPPLHAQAPFWRGLSFATFFRYTVNILSTLQFENGCNISNNAAEAAACQGVLDANDLHLGIGTSFAGLAAILVALHAASVLFLVLFGRK